MSSVELKLLAQDLRVVVPAEAMTRFGFWKPGMQTLHERLLRVLRANLVNVTEARGHAIEVAASQWSFARALVTAVAMQESVTLPGMA